MSLALSGISGLGLIAAPLEGQDPNDPFGMFAGWDGGQLVWLAILVPVAISVFWFGSRQVRSQLGSSALGPQGRGLRLASRRRAGRDEAAWRAEVVRLQDRPITAVDQAREGPVRLQGEIVATSGSLGGPAGLECVWRNRAGAPPASAVGAELIVIADATGRCGVENLEHARVIAPSDKHGFHYENVSLYCGDRIEVFGRFEPEPKPDNPTEPASVVYGTVGGDGRLEVRLVSRPDPPAASTPPTPPSADPGSDSEPSASPQAHNNDTP